MKRAAKTPLRQALRESSRLLPLVADGLGDVKSCDQGCFDDAIRSTFADSLDLDSAMKLQHSQDPRWDYLLGHAPSGELVAVEPHSAKHDEITTVIRKRTAAREQLQEHMRESARVTKWLWVASGKVHFADTEKVRRLLDQSGIEFVGTRVAHRHLPTSPSPDPSNRLARSPRKRKR